MRKIYILFIILISALLLFTSCENDPRGPKTAKEYLIGTSINSTVNGSFSDSPRFSEPMNIFIALSFEEDGSIIVDGRKIRDYNEEWEGMDYKISFTIDSPSSITGSDAAIPAYYELNLKILNESCVLLTGSITKYNKQMILNGDVLLSAKYPSWLRDSDWVICDPLYSEAPAFLVQSESSGPFLMGEETENIIKTGSYCTNDSYTQLMEYVSTDNENQKITRTTSYTIRKISADEATYTSSVTEVIYDKESNTEETNTTEGNPIKVKKIDNLPFWIEGVNSLTVDGEALFDCPISNESISSFNIPDTTSILEVDRICEKDSLEIVFLAQAADRKLKISFIIEKNALESAFSCTKRIFEIDESGNEAFINEYKGIGTPYTI